MIALDQARMFGRFTVGLPRFLRQSISLEDARLIIARCHQEREKNFLLLMQRAVYDRPLSPYLALLRWAGVEYGDLESFVWKNGVDAALEKLFDAGVRVGLDEFKGKRPIERTGLTLDVSADDFDNPLLARQFELASGGSTGARRRMAIDFELLVHEAALQLFYYTANGFAGRPGALWWPIPPGAAGMKNVLCCALMGNPFERWFSAQPLSFQGGLLPSAVFTSYAAACGRLMGGAIPRPKFTPLDQGARVAQWAAEWRKKKLPWVCLPTSNGVRVAQAAIEAGLDISGTVFRTGGEPLTAAKYAAIRKAGADAVNGWSLSEAGQLAGCCPHRDHPDESHVFTEKVAMIQRQVNLRGGSETVSALHLTTLLLATPKLMLNVEIGDYGVLFRRHCGCALEQAGLSLHVHTIRSYEKITANGMHFIGTQLTTIIEEDLPRALGGAPTDYQFVEEEDGAASRVTVLVSPRIGQLDEARVISTVLNALAGHSRGESMMAGNWRQSGVLRVARREPYSTPNSKTPAVRVIRSENGPAGGPLGN